jgi:hypothetical protein
VGVIAEAQPVDPRASVVRDGRAVYCVSDSAHFLGVVALVNSLRLTGWDDEIVLVDCGLTRSQRELLERETQIVDVPAVVAPHLLKVVGPLARPAGVIVLLDADLIVTRSLEPLVVEAHEDARLIAFADALHDRFDGRWSDLLGLGELRRQTYVNSGFIVASAEPGLRVLKELQEAQTHIDIRRSMIGNGTPDDPFYFPDQDALNAILASARVDAKLVRILDHELAPHPPFPGVRIVDAERLKVTSDDGREPFALHHIQRKPWLVPLGSTPYSRLLPRLWLADDLPLRLVESQVPLRFRPGRMGAAGAGYAAGRVTAERARSVFRRRLQAVAGRPLPQSEALGPDRLWRRVEELAAQAPTLADLRAHRLESFEIRRLRRLGQPVPDELAQQELGAVASARGAEALLRAAREAFDGRLVLMKGYEVALRYPEPWLRPFSDIDLLADDSAAAQRALLAAGFVEVGDAAIFAGIHHLRPLWWPGSTLVIELHHEPKWPDGDPSPVPEELFEAAVPSRSGVDGIQRLPDSMHALALAAHSWAHLPLRRLLDLVDIAAVADGVPRDELVGLAERWGIGRIWNTSLAVTEEVLLAGGATSAGALWGRHLAAARDRTVFESHLERWLSPLWAHALPRALSEIGPRILDEIRPGQGEGWRDKNARIVHASRNALTSRSEHDRQLGPAAHRRRRR